MSEGQPTRCCIHLRTRSMYAGSGERPGLLREDDDTTVYWCQQTDTPVGPDGEDATPSRCHVGRPCCLMS